MQSLFWWISSLFIVNILLYRNDEERRLLVLHHTAFWECETLRLGLTVWTEEWLISSLFSVFTEALACREWQWFSEDGLYALVYVYVESSQAWKMLNGTNTRWVHITRSFWVLRAEIIQKRNHHSCSCTNSWSSFGSIVSCCVWITLAKRFSQLHLGRMKETWLRCLV